LDEIAWYDKNSDGKTHPVAQKKSNAYGLYDMLGNVWEWCNDFYGEYLQEAVTNPTGPESGTCRVLRGGSWISDSRNVRSAYRDWFEPSFRDVNTGFRLARGQK
jgi:formylglycine-generating enzyme required for sulfatase activity